MVPYEIIDDKGKPNFRVKFQGKEKFLSPVEITSLILTKMK